MKGVLKPQQVTGSSRAFVKAQIAIPCTPTPLLARVSNSCGVCLDHLESPQMWGSSAVEAGGTCGERIYPRQSKGDRNLWNTPQGSHGKDSKGETVCNGAVGGAVLKGGGEEVWGLRELCLVVNSPLVSERLWISWGGSPDEPVCIQPRGLTQAPLPWSNFHCSSLLPESSLCDSQGLRVEGSSNICLSKSLCVMLMALWGHWLRECVDNSVVMKSVETHAWITHKIHVCVYIYMCVCVCINILPLRHMYLRGRIVKFSDGFSAGVEGKIKVKSEHHVYSLRGCEDDSHIRLERLLRVGGKGG